MLLVIPLVIGIIGLFLEVTLFWRVYREEHLLQLLLTYALVLILDDLVRAIWGETRGMLPVLIFLRVLWSSSACISLQRTYLSYV
jgi:branched-subunit amino acid ABC-type transport system permease component